MIVEALKITFMTTKLFLRSHLKPPKKEQLSWWKTLTVVKTDFILFIFDIISPADYHMLVFEKYIQMHYKYFVCIRTDLNSRYHAKLVSSGYGIITYDDELQ